MLVDAIKNDRGPTYSWAENTFIGYDTNGDEQGGNIQTAYIYIDSRVQLMSVNTVTEPTDQQMNPSNPFFNSRFPLVGNFMSRQTCGMIQLVNVYLFSKSGSAPIFSNEQPFYHL